MATINPQAAVTVPPLAVYIHLPWCVRKCPYCDFNSHPVTGAVPEARYAQALLRDLELQSASLGGREVHSVFIGGGTPSLFAPATIGRILDGVRRQMRNAPDLEVTLEANPGTIERGRFAEYRAAGITRVSLGGQSFNATHLRTLGRIHSADETRVAAAELHAAGLANFNIDLMYGLPDQSLQEAEEDVRVALALAPAHLSHYQLTLEPGTAYFYRPPALPDEDVCWQMQQRCQERLAQGGFAQYEISAYAPGEKRCRHNLNYWMFGDYLGLGAGAHGKITALDGIIRRTVHPRQPRRYMESMEAGGGQLQTRVINALDLPFEFMLNALRLIEGWEAALFESRTGLPLQVVAPQLGAALARGLLESAAGRWRPSALGLRFLNELQMMFLPPEKATLHCA